jgi:hypothetical protein
MGPNLGEDDDVPRKKFLNFWQNMNVFSSGAEKQIAGKKLGNIRNDP